MGTIWNMEAWHSQKLSFDELFSIIMDMLFGWVEYSDGVFVFFWTFVGYTPLGIRTAAVWISVFCLFSLLKARHQKV
jgi:hypothetical protein